MSVVSDGFSSIGISFNDEDVELKKNFIECLGETCEEDDEIFDEIYEIPNELQKFADLKYLCIESFLHLEKTEDIFLLLVRLFPKSYMFQADDWDKDFMSDEDDWDDEDDEDDWDDEDESGEVFGEKELAVFDSDNMTKNKYTLTFHEVLDMDGGSNGADIDFKDDEKAITEKIAKVDPDAGFVEEILEKAIEKGYQELADLIKENI